MPVKSLIAADLQSILITQSQIHARVLQLGRRISDDYQGREPVLVCVLKGAVVFFTDLMRALSIPVSCEFIQLTSYGDGTRSSGRVKVVQGLSEALHGTDVLIVEDIIDTGHTLNFLVDQVRGLQPASVKVCSLLDKRARRVVEATIDYIGFEIPDAFVVGYGLDYAQRYRNLPYIAILDPAGVCHEQEEAVSTE